MNLRIGLSLFIRQQVDGIPSLKYQIAQNYDGMQACKLIKFMQLNLNIYDFTEYT